MVGDILLPCEREERERREREKEREEREKERRERQSTGCHDIVDKVGSFNWKSSLFPCHPVGTDRKDRQT